MATPLDGALVRNSEAVMMLTEYTGTRATVDLDAYSPTPFEPISHFGGKPAPLVSHGNQSQPLHNSTEPAGPSPRALMLPIQADLLNTEQASDAYSPSISDAPPGITESSVPIPATADTTAICPAVADSTPTAITAEKSLPAAPITDPLIASVPPPTSATPRTIVSAVAPPAIVTPPSPHATTAPQPATGPVPVASHTDPVSVPPLTSATQKIIVSSVAPPAIATPPSLQNAIISPQPATGTVLVAYQANPETLAVPPDTSAAPAITAGELPAVHSSLAATAPSSHQGAAIAQRAEGPEKLTVPPSKKAKTMTVTRGKRPEKDKLKIDKTITLWRDLSKEQKGKLLYERKKAFHKRASHGKPIPFRTRLWARREASFMPELATHSKELAVMALTSIMSPPQPSFIPVVGELASVSFQKKKSRRTSSKEHPRFMALSLNTYYSPGWIYTERFQVYQLPKYDGPICQIVAAARGGDNILSRFQMAPNCLLQLRTAAQRIFLLRVHLIVYWK